MEIKYFSEIKTIFIKPIGHLTTRSQLDELVLEFEKIHSNQTEKFWIISDVTEFMIKSASLLKYFAEKMIGMDKDRYGTIFILKDSLRRTGVQLLRYYRKVNFYTAFDFESAKKIIESFQEK